MVILKQHKQLAEENPEKRINDQIAGNPKVERSPTNGIPKEERSSGKTINDQRLTRNK